MIACICIILSLLPFKIHIVHGPCINSPAGREWVHLERLVTAAVPIIQSSRASACVHLCWTHECMCALELWSVWESFCLHGTCAHTHKQEKGHEGATKVRSTFKGEGNRCSVFVLEGFKDANRAKEEKRTKCWKRRNSSDRRAGQTRRKLNTKNNPEKHERKTRQDKYLTQSYWTRSSEETDGGFSSKCGQRII